MHRRAACALADSVRMHVDTGRSAAPPLRPDLLWDTRFADIALRPSKSTEQSTLLALYARAWAANLPFSLPFALFSTPLSHLSRFLLHSHFFCRPPFYLLFLPFSYSFLPPLLFLFFPFSPFCLRVCIFFVPVSTSSLVYLFVTPPKLVFSSFCPLPLSLRIPFCSTLFPTVSPFSLPMLFHPLAPYSREPRRRSLLVSPLISTSHFCSIHDPLFARSPLFRRLSFAPSSRCLFIFVSHSLSIAFSTLSSAARVLCSRSAGIIQPFSVQPGRMYREISSALA